MQELRDFQMEAASELANILVYWSNYTQDDQYGGFVGRIDQDNNVDHHAAKGSVLNSRILWTYSAVYKLTKLDYHLKIATRAYDYIVKHFIDPEFGGVYWTLDYKGNPLDTKKQVYAQAFALYGVCEYYNCTGDTTALQTAVELYHLIVSKSFDPVQGGYFEAFTRDWQPMADLRLSEKDANEKKTMNTHLHLLEAFTNLYRYNNKPQVKEHVTGLIHNFLNHIIDRGTFHLNLFFDENWEVKPGLVSFGHDIEAAWLLKEAAEVIQDLPLLDRVKAVSVRLADAASEGLDQNGGLCYEYDTVQKNMVKEKHWWVQAEAVVGFLKTWQVTGDEKYLRYSRNSWKFIREYIVDKEYGDWVWGIDDMHLTMQGQDKVGIWKCPYHNARACLEIINSIC